MGEAESRRATRLTQDLIASAAPVYVCGLVARTAEGPRRSTPRYFSRSDRNPTRPASSRSRPVPLRVTALGRLPIFSNTSRRQSGTEWGLVVVGKARGSVARFPFSTPALSPRISALSTNMPENSSSRSALLGTPVGSRQDRSDKSPAPSASNAEQKSGSEGQGGKGSPFTGEEHDVRLSQSLER